MSKVNILAPYVPFLDSRGHITREWYAFLHGFFTGNQDDEAVEEAAWASARPQAPSSGLESAIRELSTIIQTQRGERAAIEMLAKRVSELESILYGSHPWH